MTTVARVPDLAGPRARRLRGPLLTAAGLGTAALALVVRDPHRHGSWGLCPFKAITGWDCPGCGGLRAVNDLGHGQLLDAAHSNLLFVASLPLLLGLWVLAVQRGWTGRAPHRLAPRTTRALVAAGTVLALAFTVYRNTPWGSAWFVA
jgi:hypothetical protein